MKKTAIVTGANTGLGFAAAKGLVERDYHVVLACRSREKGRAAQKELGPNALFRYKGKLYHTNHPNEVNQNIASGFKELNEKKSIDDIFANYAD